MFTKPLAVRTIVLRDRRGMLRALCAVWGVVVFGVAVFGVAVFGVAYTTSALAAPAADKLPAADRKAIETTIRRQLDAFVADDAERAFGFATPEIQKQFGSADRFMQVVRDRYDAVYRPGSVYFSRLAMIDGDWIQAVQVTDQEGKVWRALFTMHRQPDRGWKVGGCQLVETSALST